MKFLSIIFSVYIISLMTAPALAVIDFVSDTQCSSASCCAPNPQEQPTDNDENGCNDFCNPFLSCCTCSGLTTPVIASISQSLEQIETQSTFYRQSPPIQYIHSIWHPPKIG